MKKDLLSALKTASPKKVGKLIKRYIDEQTKG